MKTLVASSLLCCIALTGCGGGAEIYIEDGRPPPPVRRPIYEFLTHPTVSGLEYFNSSTGSQSQLTTAAGGYTSYTGDNSVAFVLGDILLFTLPGTLPQRYLSLYDANRYATSTLYSDTAVENLMAFFMAIDDDGNYTNGIQIAYPVRIAARGLRMNFNQSAYNFRADPAVQYATAVLSGNTLYGPRSLPSPIQAALALQTP